MTRPLPQPVRVFSVGGAVRDELLGRAVADRDFVVVGATPEMMLASGYRPVGRDFPVFLHPETQDEYALARTERKHGHGYRGFEFFASPDVTLEEDLVRRDLTINAMARDEYGTLIDPWGGERDLREGVLRHVSAAFAEDPLRVLRVARFAARFAFDIAPETLTLMRQIVAAGEIATLSIERVWQEFAKGLTQRHPARMFSVLRSCGALVQVMPEVDALFGATHVAGASTGDAGERLLAGLQWAAARELSLEARYALLAHELFPGLDMRGQDNAAKFDVRANVRLAERLSARLKVPIECRDGARLAARWCRALHRASTLRPAQLLDLFAAADALRRPGRLAMLLDVGTADWSAERDASAGYPQAAHIRAALAAVRGVDAGEVARAVAATGTDARGDRVGRALRAARLTALRRFLAQQRRAAPIRGD